MTSSQLTAPTLVTPHVLLLNAGDPATITLSLVRDKSEISFRCTCLAFFDSLHNMGLKNTHRSCAHLPPWLPPARPHPLLLPGEWNGAALIGNAQTLFGVFPAYIPDQTISPPTMLTILFGTALHIKPSSNSKTLKTLKGGLSVRLLGHAPNKNRLFVAVQHGPDPQKDWGWVASEATNLRDKYILSMGIFRPCDVPGLQPFTGPEAAAKKASKPAPVPTPWTDQVMTVPVTAKSAALKAIRLAPKADAHIIATAGDKIDVVGRNLKGDWLAIWPFTTPNSVPIGWIKRSATKLSWESIAGAPCLDNPAIQTEAEMAEMAALMPPPAAKSKISFLPTATTTTITLPGPVFTSPAYLVTNLGWTKSGGSVEVLGRNEDGQWLLIRYPTAEAPQQVGWINRSDQTQLDYTSLLPAFNVEHSPMVFTGDGLPTPPPAAKPTKPAKSWLPVEGESKMSVGPHPDTTYGVLMVGANRVIHAAPSWSGASLGMRRPGEDVVVQVFGRDEFGDWLALRWPAPAPAPFSAWNCGWIERHSQTALAAEDVQNLPHVDSDGLALKPPAPAIYVTITGNTAPESRAPRPPARKLEMDFDGDE